MSQAPLRAHVHNGRLTLDEPTELPEGSEVQLVPAIELDDLDDDDRARLHAAIDEGIDQMRRGETMSAEQFLRELRSRR
jgi:hypothetical protein